MRLFPPTLLYSALYFSVDASHFVNYLYSLFVCCMLNLLKCRCTNVNQHFRLKIFRLLGVTDTECLWELALMRSRGFLKHFLMQHSQIYIQTSACICIIGGCSGHVPCIIKHSSGEKMILIIWGHRSSCSASFIPLAACLDFFLFCFVCLLEVEQRQCIFRILIFTVLHLFLKV